MEFMTGEWFGRLFGVLVVNLILSGDNALVIAMAARTLEGANRKKAIVFGAAGAVVLRIIFAGVITLLLEVPLLQVAGGYCSYISPGGSSTRMVTMTTTRRR